MIQAKCIQKFRNKQNQIYRYSLQDNQGNTKDVTPQQLKTAIQNNQINVINLKLTSDNRLIDTTPTQQTEQKHKPAPKQQFSLLTRKIVKQIDRPKALKFKSNQNLEAINSKAPILGYTKNQLSDDFLSIENNTEIILMSNKQIQLDNTDLNVGLFEETKFKSIDFHNTDTSNITDMKCMFFKCQAKNLDISSFDTSNVANMACMFELCQAQTLDLSNFDTSNVTDMKSMFKYCQAKNLDISSFNTFNVRNMVYMFFKCQAQTIDLSRFSTSNVTDISNTYKIFDNCQAQIKTTDSKLLKKIPTCYK